MPRFLVRLVLGQLAGLALLAAVAVRWPATATQLEAGLRTFAVALAGVVVVVVGWWVVLIIRSQLEPPYDG